MNTGGIYEYVQYTKYSTNIGYQQYQSNKRIYIQENSKNRRNAQNDKIRMKGSPERGIVECSGSCVSTVASQESSPVTEKKELLLDGMKVVCDGLVIFSKGNKFNLHKNVNKAYAASKIMNDPHIKYIPMPTFL